MTVQMREINLLLKVLNHQLPSKSQLQIKFKSFQCIAKAAMTCNIIFSQKNNNTIVMRKLKHHEQKLLKKVNFYDWKVESDKRESKIIHKYHLQNREDYKHYNKICGLVTSLISKIKNLPPDDEFRIKATEQLLEKLYNMGIITTRENILSAEKVSVSAFCRRRLAVLLCQLKYAETMKEAVTFIEQGHVRIGTEIVTQPSFLVTRQMEDHVGWVDNSSIKKKILQHNGKFDDYDMMN